MIVRLLRTYHEQGTNGEIWFEEEFICYAIELPWLANVRNISCIPEGRYVLAKRFSKRFKWHIWVKDVSDRGFILFHAANDSLKELKGCIAPVSRLTAVGRGEQSRLALGKLRALVYRAIDAGVVVKLDVLS